jgi:hypothetical protein
MCQLYCSRANSPRRADNKIDPNMPPDLHDDPTTTLVDRLAFALLGALAGAVYGGLMAGVVYWVTRASHVEFITFAAGVFGVMGFFFGNFVLQALLSLVHFFWHMASMELGNTHGVDDRVAQRPLRNFLLLGLGTAVVFVLWRFA